MQGVEGLLRQLSVRWLVLPSIRTVLPMWRYSFNFIPLTLEEQAALEPHIVSPGELSQLLLLPLHVCSDQPSTVCLQQLHLSCIQVAAADHLGLCTTLKRESIPEVLLPAVFPLHRL
jgi:hypothetical protein